MPQYKHVSVDFWHTLGFPNPDYPRLRSTELAKLYGVTPQHADRAYRVVKNQEESDAVAGGVPPTMTQLQLQFNVAMGRFVDHDAFQQCVLRLWEHFAACPPALCQRSLLALRALRNNGVTVSVGSNTNFIVRGASIRRVLPRTLFSFELYSDELKLCKPNPAFFSHVLVKAVGCNPSVQHPREVLHVGDSRSCDYAGAAAAGLSAAHVTPLHSTASILENLLSEEEKQVAHS